MMVCLTKGHKDTQPRCEHVTQRGERCRMNGTLIENGKHSCVHHRLGGRIRSTKSQVAPPQEQLFIATYSDGMDLKRKEVFAQTREQAYRFALERAPAKHKLTGLRVKGTNSGLCGATKLRRTA